MTASDYESEFAASLTEQAAYLCSLGRFADALEPSTEACEIYGRVGKTGEPRGRAEAFTRHVIILARLDRMDEARWWARRARREWHDPRSPEGHRARNRMLVVRTLHVISTLQILAGEDRQAADTAEDALAVVPGSRIGERGPSELRLQVRLLTTRAMALAGAGRPRQAAEAADEALRKLANLAEAAELSGALQSLAHPEREQRPSPRLLLTGLETTLSELAGMRSAGVTAGDSVQLHRRLTRNQHEAARPSLLTALATRFTQLSTEGRDEEASDALTEAISTARALLNDGDPGYGRHVTRVMDDIGRFLWSRLDEESPGGLDQVVDVMKLAFDGSAEAGDAGRTEVLINLGSALLTRYEQRAESRDLDEVIYLLRESGQHSQRSGLRWDLALLASRALTYRYDLTGDQTDLDEAIEHGLTAIATAGPGPGADPSGGLRAGAMSDLGTMLLHRYATVGTPGDLEAALTLIRRSLDALGSRHPRRARSLVNLGSVLCARYDLTRDLGDLDQAIDATREALTDETLRIRALEVLGAALVSRYRASGRWPDLDEAVTTLRRLISELPGEGEARAAHLAELAFILRLRYDRTGDPADLSEALAAGREAVGLLPPHHPHAASARLHLTGVLSALYSHSGDPGLLDEAVALAGETVSQAPETAPDRAEAVAGLARALGTRWRALGRKEDLTRAISCARQAVEHLPTGHTTRSELVGLLGELLRLGVEHDADHGMLGQSMSLAFEHGSPGITLTDVIDVLRGEATTPDALPLERIRAAERLGRLAMTADQPDVALEGYGLAIDLLPLALAARRDLPTWRGGTEPGDMDELVNDAAAAAMAAGRPDQAAVLLERGRVALLSHSPGPDRLLEQVRKTAPELAHRYAELSDRMAQAEAVDSEHRALAAEWTQLLRSVRTLPGLASFLTRPTVQSLMAQAGDGPLVMVNVSRYRSDAVIVTTDGVSAVPLPGLHHAELSHQLDRFRSALSNRYAPMEDHLKAEGPLNDVLHWLWSTVAAPVLDALGLRDPLPGAPLPRLWWIPTGLLGLFPLHAAQDRTLTNPPSPGASPLSALDCVCPSYAVTVSALATARAAPHAPPSALVVAPTGSPRVADLPHARREANEVRDRLRAARLLAGTEATTTAVLSRLAEASVLHVAAHGVMNPGSLRTGGLELADGLLTTTALRHAQSPAPQLAFLSACQTVPYPPAETETPWQAVSLAAALHLGGYRHTVGTLWEVEDRMHADMSALFYEALGASGSVDTDDSPRALHHAVLRVRARYPHIPSLWAAHIHVGP
ncbi:CHAT domain-containing protein [Streptomyces sp. NPDC055025]